MEIQHGCAASVFGPVFLAMVGDSILVLSFVSSEMIPSELNKLKKKWPHAIFVESSTLWAQTKIEDWIPSTFCPSHQVHFRPYEQGTEFQKKVWQALLQIPPGQTCSYSDIAEKIGHPQAVRAVGSAVGANPIGYLIPCHRVLPKSGGIGQFGWGPEMKRRMLEFEKAIQPLRADFKATASPRHRQAQRAL